MSRRTTEEDKQAARLRKWDLRWLATCKFHSQWSKDPSTKCAAVITENINGMVSFGYNGYPSGVKDDNTLNIREQKYPRIIHAEINAILFAKRKLNGCTLYVFPLAPCAPCASVICQSGITRVVTVDPEDISRKGRWSSSNDIAMDMFNQKNIEVVKYAESEVTMWMSLEE